MPRMSLSIEMPINKLKDKLNVKEAEIRAAYREYKDTVPPSKRRSMIPYSEFKRRFLERKVENILRVVAGNDVAICVNIKEVPEND